MKKEYIATYGISNCMGLGIVEINHSDDMVEFDSVVGDEVVDNTITSIVMKYDENSEDMVMGFMWGANFIPFGECMRTH